MLFVKWQYHRRGIWFPLRCHHHNWFSLPPLHSSTSHFSTTQFRFIESDPHPHFNPRLLNLRQGVLVKWNVSHSPPLTSFASSSIHDGTKSNTYTRQIHPRQVCLPQSPMEIRPPRLQHRQTNLGIGLRSKFAQALLKVFRKYLLLITCRTERMFIHGPSSPSAVGGYSNAIVACLPLIWMNLQKILQCETQTYTEGFYNGQENQGREANTIQIAIHTD